MSSSDTDNSGSSSFESAVDEGVTANLKMEPDGEVFETSGDCQLANMDTDTCTPNSSGCSSRVDWEALWAKFPEGTKEIIEHASGILYIERYTSFIENKWPYDVKKRNLCHPRALALAGLEFCSLEPSPSVKCVVCLKVLHDLEPNSNPWVLHSEINPDCLIVQLGQRDKVDDYCIDEIMEMILTKIYNDAKLKLVEKENHLKKQLFALKQHEKTLGIQN